VSATPPEVEAAPTLPTPEVLPPPVPECIIPAPIPDLAKERPPAIAAASPPAEMPEEMGLAPTAAPANASPPSVPAIEVEEIDNDAQIHGETHDARLEPPSRKRPAREAARRVSTETAEVLDSLGATIESVLASRWYGSDRPSAYSGRVLRADEIAPVTPSGLIAELATVQKQETPAAAPHRRKGRIIAALCLVAIFAAALFASLSWRSGHGLHLPTRMPAIFGALSLSDPERRTADGEAAGRQRASAAFFAT
jgi:hypothetical protein